MKDCIFENYKISTANAMCMKEIKAVGKGSVDMSLRGLYTNVDAAKKDILMFLGTPKGVKRDAKKQSNG